MTRVGFLPFASTLQFAGATYLDNLFRALDTARAPGLERVLFLDGSTPRDLAGALRGSADVVIEHESTPLSTLSTEAAAQQRATLLERAGVDVTFEIYGDQFAQPSVVPRLGWITDFQHLHGVDRSLSHVAAHRDRACRVTAREATRLVVSSHDGLRDLDSIDKQAAQRADVMQFVACVPDTVYARDPLYIAERYHLPEKFVYLPNQCWKHKDLITAVRALAILKEQGQDMFLVCTGDTTGPRDHLDFGNMLEEISRLGVRDQIVFLGRVPQEAVYPLMRQSVFVLEPSLFEGWSTTVEEAKSLGKGVVLSDLEVHQEQAPAGASYFRRGDPQALAEVLLERWRTQAPGPDFELEEEARRVLPERVRAYGRRFAQIIGKTLRTACSAAAAHGRRAA